MHRAIDYLMAAAIGSTISFMVVFNTRLGEVAGMPVSFIFNHAIGIVVITLIMIVFRIRRGYPAKRQKAPWYFWFGGVFGFIILNANYITIVNIGASLAMATAVLGQSLGSLGFDLTGFMGRKTYPITPQKSISLLIGFLGIAIMASEGGTFAIPYVIIGTLTGVITMVQLVYNSRFAAYKGVFFSARNNVVSGLLFALLIYSITDAETIIASFASIGSVPLPLILGGGLLAILVVAGSNHVVPRIPAIYSAMLLSSAQIITSIVIDWYLYDLFSMRMLIGALVILIAMGMNMWIDRKAHHSVQVSETIP